MNQSLLKEFSDCNPRFMEEFNTLPEQYRTKIIRKLQNENSRINFLSKISEYHFVRIFVKQGFDFDYEPTINNKKPDLRIRKNDSEIIGDIKRFNLSEEDQIKDRFFYELATQLKTIKLPYWVHINQLQCFSFELFDVIDISEKFHTWLISNSVKVGDVFNYNGLFDIKITNLNGIKGYILFSYHTLDNKIHPNKIVSIVNDKIQYYYKSLISNGYPFFICIDLVSDSLLSPEDFEVEYHGGSALNMDTGIESFHLGEFYTIELYSKLLGILIRYNNQFYWIRNYRTENYLQFNLE